MQRGGKTQGGLAGWCYFLLLCFPLVLPLVVFLSALFFYFMGSVLSSDLSLSLSLSLSLLCLLCFYCVTCVCSFSSPGFLVLSMCFLSSFVLCVFPPPWSSFFFFSVFAPWFSGFFYLSVFSPVLCPPVRSLFFVLFRSPILWFSPCSSPLFLGISSVCVFPQRFLFCPLGSIPHRLWLFPGLYKAIECHALVRQMKRTHKTVTLIIYQLIKGGKQNEHFNCTINIRYEDLNKQ